MIKSIWRIGAVSSAGRGHRGHARCSFWRKAPTIPPPRRNRLRPRRIPPRRRRGRIPSTGNWRRWTRPPRPSRWASQFTRSRSETKITKAGKPADSGGRRSRRARLWLCQAGRGREDGWRPRCILAPRLTQKGPRRRRPSRLACAVTVTAATSSSCSWRLCRPWAGV